ncbi:MAG: hypothetical protein EKK48_19055 [Candidatus Melainabacteria bacterium]|nr:MAG: hypothetical protein EKK48_19055 [Candidatus Melainabacteria bacterium]
MINLNNITGTVSSKKKAGVVVKLADGRRGFLPTAAFGDVNPKKGDTLTVDIVSQEKDALQLALSKKETAGQKYRELQERERNMQINHRDPGTVALITYPGHGLDLGQMPVNDFTHMMFGVEIPSDAVDAEGQGEELSRFVGAHVSASESHTFVLGVTNPLAGGLDPVAAQYLVDGPADEMSPGLAAAIEDAKTCFLGCTNVVDPVPEDGPPVRSPLLFTETEHSCGALEEVMAQAAPADEGTVTPVTETKKSLGDKKGPRSKAWEELRGFAAAERRFQVTFKRVVGQPGLLGFYNGVRCFLPQSELPSSFDIGSVPAKGTVEWVKVVSTSRQKNTCFVSMRISVPLDELLKAYEGNITKTATTRKETLAAIERDYEWLSEGQDVDGTVVNILTHPGKDGQEPRFLYFVKVGTELAGVLRCNQVPFVKGTRQRRVFKIGDQVHVRVAHKFRRVDEKTGASMPKVDLSMRGPAHPKQSKNRPPRVWTFGEKTNAPGYTVHSKAGNEQDRRGKGKGGKPGQGKTGKNGGKDKRKGGNTQPHLTAPGTAIGDKLQAALAARLA